MPKALVVDDEVDMRWVLSEVLRVQGFKVDTAEGGQAALEQITAEPPDVVLLDLKMPGVDGIQVLERTRAVDPHIPVVMVTAYGDLPSAVQAMRLGAYDYLTKPFDNDEILSSVRQALEKRELEATRLMAARVTAIRETTRTVSHEINNPLTAILGHAQMLEQEVKEAEVAGRAKVIIEGCRRIAGVIRRLSSVVEPAATVNSVVGAMLDLARLGPTGEEPTDHGTNSSG